MKELTEENEKKIREALFHLEEMLPVCAGAIICINQILEKHDSSISSSSSSSGSSSMAEPTK